VADLDLSLVSAVLAGGKQSIRLLAEKGFRADLLEGDGKVVYDFATAFYKTYDDVPSASLVERETGVLVPAPTTDPLPYLINAAYDRKLHTTLHGGVKHLINLLDLGEPAKGQAAVEDLLREMRKLDTRTALVESIPGLGGKVIEYYEKIKRGERGIQTPWPTINDSTLGLWPEDLVLFVARMGIGKTWSAILLAGTAWDQGKKVLIATTEMSKETMAMRYLATKFRIPYGDFRRGKLDSFTEKRIRDGIKAIENSPNLNIVGGDFDFSMDSFAGIVMDEKPDLVIVDGAYLLKVHGLTRTERAANVFDELKRIAKRSKAAVVATMQFNREVKVNQAKTVQADSIAMTDVAGWNADLIFGLIQTEEMKKNRRMAFKPLKVREGESEEIECNWDFERMDFSEIPKANFGGSPAFAPSGVPSGPDAAADDPIGDLF
jgi:KaiC/GvpD/RAD55 family RecA-like ATPase